MLFWPLLFIQQFHSNRELCCTNTTVINLTDGFLQSFKGDFFSIINLNTKRKKLLNHHI